MSTSRPVVLRLRYPLSKRSLYFAVSAVVHAVFAVAIVLFPGLRSGSAPPEDIVVVDLVGAFPAASAPAPVQTRSEPEPPAEGVRIETKEPPPEPVAKKEPPRDKPEPKKEPRQQPAPGPPGDSSAEADGPRGRAGTGGDSRASIASLDLGDMEHAWYRASVVTALQSQWVRPILEGNPQTLEVTVAFEIQSDGAVRNVTIEAPSGVPSLDRSALRAVADASPLPPVPTSWRQPVVPARFVFRLHPGTD